MKPEMRFDGFKDEWKTKRINEIATVTSGLTPLRSNASFFVDGTIPWVKTMDLNNASVIKTSEKVTEKALSDTTLRLLPENTLLIAMYGGFKQIGRTGIIKFKGATNQAISALTPIGNSFSPSYLQGYLNFNVNQWIRLAASSRKDPNITKTDIENFLVALPQKEEQEKIATFFSLIGQRIEKQLEKIKQLEELKKGVMQKVFSREIRFRDENEEEFSEWESIRFENVVEKLIGGGTPSRKVVEYYDGEIPWVTVKDLKTNKYISDAEEYITELGLNNSSSKIVNKGDLIIPTRMAVGKILIAQEDVAINQDLKGCKLKAGYDTEFIYYLYSSKAIAIERLASGSTVTGISIDDLMGIKIEVASLKEQERIAGYLSSLDMKLKNERMKSKLLIEQKKGFMQRMFV